jgi:hypothetical protein
VRKSRQNDATLEKKQERKEEKNQKRESFFERFLRNTDGGFHGLRHAVWA